MISPFVSLSGLEDKLTSVCLALGSFHFLSAPPLRMAGFRPLKVLAAPFEEKNPTPLVQKLPILRGGSDKKWNVPFKFKVF